MNVYLPSYVRAFLYTGYRYDSDEDAWKAVKVFPRWQEKYPEPVDFVGVTRIYQPEVDKPVFRALQVRVVGSHRCTATAVGVVRV